VAESAYYEAEQALPEAKSANFVPDYNGFKVAIEANNKNKSLLG